MEHRELTQAIIGCAMTVHRTLGPGFLDSVYQNALAHELTKAGLRVECQKSIRVLYDGIAVGEFYADMLVEGCVLVENKAMQTLVIGHERQLINYLAPTGVDVGLLLNFGSPSLQFKRKSRVYRRRETGSQDEQD